MAFTVVQLTDHLTHGDTMHRLTWPMQALARLPEFHVIDVHYLSPYRYQLAFDADLLVLCMVGDVELVPIIRWRRAKGKPTVFEVNNYFFELDPWHPDFDDLRNPLWEAYGLQMMQMADLVQTSTAFLAKAFEPYCSRVAVFPNQLASVPDSLPPRSDHPLVVGWGGSVTHIVDIARVAPAVSRWVREHDDVVLWIMSHKAVSDLFSIPSEKKRFVPWGDIGAYEEFLRGVHVGLAPLCDTAFNRGRSDVKWLEYTANGCLFVGQRLDPYADSVDDGKTGFLFDHAAGLVRILGRLYKERRLLESVRAAAFDYVTKNRRHEAHIRERAEVYKGLLEREPPKGGERWNLHEQTQFPRPDLADPLPDYLPFTLEGEEEKALAALYSERPDLAAESVALLEERYGEFHATEYCRGRLALARQDPARAEQHLRRSISMYPAAVVSVKLLGEVLLGMQRVREAREMLSRAVEWNRAFVPAYRPLVAAAELESDWEGGIAATENWEKDCNEDPFARARKGLLLIRAGRAQEGMDAIADGMTRVKGRLDYWQLPFAAELVEIFRQADPWMSNEEGWSDLVLKAADLFPYGWWLAARAGGICLERGEYPRGAAILQAAKGRLLDWEWQTFERGSAPRELRRLIEPCRTACEELTR